MDIKQQVYDIVGACMEVHRELHPGLQEVVYQEALMYELQDKGIPFEREVRLPIQYKGHTLDKYYQMDFVCYGDIILELKAANAFTDEHRFQLFTYLRLTKKPVGLLINFGEKSLHTERYVYDAATGKIEGFNKLDKEAINKSFNKKIVL